MLAFGTLFTTNPGACLVILSNSLDSPQGYTKPSLTRFCNIRHPVPRQEHSRPESEKLEFVNIAFYPVNWLDIPRLSKKPRTTGEATWVEMTVQDMSKESYMVHLWNKVTRKIENEEGSVMQKLISTHCTVCGDIINCHV